MSAATSKPLAGQHKSAAPFGAVAILAGVVALGAIGIAYGQSVRTAAPAGPDIQTIKDQDQSVTFGRLTVDYPDQIPARVGTAGSKVSDYPDQIPARVGTAGSKVSDYPDQLPARLGAFGSEITGTGTGPQTAAQRGLVSPDRWTILQQDQFRQYLMSRNAAPVQPLHAHPARHPMAN
jgi:hypothetical protein